MKKIHLVGIAWAAALVTGFIADRTGSTFCILFTVFSNMGAAALSVAYIMSEWDNLK